MSMRRAISILTAAILVVGCAHAGQRGGATEEQASREDTSGEEAETIDDALEVELEDIQQVDSTQREELDSRFWEKSDGISSDTVFRRPPATEEQTTSGAVATARDRVAHAQRRGRRDMLESAIAEAPDESVEQIIAWREQLVRLSVGDGAEYAIADLATIRRGLEHAVAEEDWERVIELEGVFRRVADELGRRDVRSQRGAVVAELDAFVRWRRPVVVAAHYHLGHRDDAKKLAAMSVARANRAKDEGPFARSVELAERLAELGAGEMSRELLGADVLNAAGVVTRYRGRPVGSTLLETGLRVLGRTGASDELIGLWARRYLQSKATASAAAFRGALNTCNEYVDERHCWVDTPLVPSVADATADVKLACRYYQFRREWKSEEEARDGLRRYVEACDESCRRMLDALTLESAMCGTAALSATDAVDVNEVLVAVPLQFGDLELAAELLDQQSAHPISKASVILSVRPRHHFLPSPAARLELIDRVSVWLQQAETLAEHDPGSFPDGVDAPTAIAELRVRGAEFVAEVGLEQRAIELLSELRLDAADAPRLFSRAASLLVDLGELDRVADLIVSNLSSGDERHVESWVTPLMRKLTPRHALRVYRAGAEKGYSQMARGGLALAVEQNDLESARALYEAASDDNGLRDVLTDEAEERLEREARASSEWAQFYLSVLEREPPERRSRLERIRIARVVGYIDEPDEALERWVSVFEDDSRPCAALNMSLREGPGADIIHALIRRDSPTGEDSAERLMSSMMLRMRMRRMDGDPLQIDPRFRRRVATLAQRIMDKSPMVCASPIGFADIVAGHGFPEAALEILDATRHKGLTADKNGVPFAIVQQRFLELRVALDIGDVRRAREAIARVVSARRNLRRALQRELGWYLLERGDVDEAAELLDKSLFSLERLYVEEASSRTAYEPLRRWRARRTSIERVDDTVVALARLRVRQGRGDAFTEKLARLLSRSSLDSVRRRRLAMRLVSIFDRPAQRAAVLAVIDTRGVRDQLWMLGARSEFVEGDVDRGFAKFDMRASRLASPYSFWVEQAYWFVGRGEFDLGRRAMERARRVGGDGPGLAVARGRIALLRGDDQTSMREFRSALQQLHLRTTVERRVVEALEDAGREDLIGELESDGLVERGTPGRDVDSTLQFKKLQAALRDRKPGAAIAELIALEDYLRQRGQLAAHARRVADVVATSGHPGSHELSLLLVRHELSGAARVLVDAQNGPELEDAFRLWTYLEEGVGRKAVELALEMLDPASDAYDPGNALRLVGAYDYGDRLLSAGRRSVQRLGPLSFSAPYVVDALVVRGDLGRALSHVQATAQFVGSQRDVLTSAQLERWGAMQAMLVQRGLASEARAILGYAPFRGQGGAIERRGPRRQETPRSVWRQMSRLREAERASGGDGVQPRLPKPVELGHEDLGDLAPALLRASAPFARQLVDDELLSVRVEAAPGHASVRVAWMITLYEAGEMERARQMLRGFLERHADDDEAVEMLVSQLGRRGFWSEIAIVAAPSIARETPGTKRWVERARAEVGAGDGPIDAEATGREREAVVSALRRPFPLEPHRDGVLASVLAADGSAAVSGGEHMRALRALGPLEQWCLAPDALDVVLDLARVRAAPELDELETCRRVGSRARPAPQGGYAARLEAYREGVRRGILSPADFHDYRVLRWRLGDRSGFPDEN
ncbi:MAG: hypothetical protein ACQEVA_14300 [Myxococcota bacterium]